MQQELIRFAAPQTKLPEIFRLYQLTHQFHREAHHRQAWTDHCQWYEQISYEHQQELSLLSKSQPR